MLDAEGITGPRAIRLYQASIKSSVAPCIPGGTALPNVIEASQSGRRVSTIE